MTVIPFFKEAGQKDNDEDNPTIRIDKKPAVIWSKYPYRLVLDRGDILRMECRFGGSLDGGYMEMRGTPRLMAMEECLKDFLLKIIVDDTKPDRKIKEFLSGFE